MGGLVYSSEHGRMCAACDQPIAACRCARGGGGASGGVVRVGRETKGRRGKGVTVVTGAPLAGAELTGLAKELKRRCGTGGTVKDGVIEIQGDHRDAIVAALQAKGWTVRRSGG
ncbi:MAG: translation initiation factor Sui1 [Planctomycetota bacterium]